MLTKEVREWIEKVNRGQYSYEDAMYELSQFASYLTSDELKFIKDKIAETKTTSRQWN